MKEGYALAILSVVVFTISLTVTTLNAAEQPKPAGKGHWKWIPAEEAAPQKEQSSDANKEAVDMAKKIVESFDAKDATATLRLLSEDETIKENAVITKVYILSVSTPKVIFKPMIICVTSSINRFGINTAISVKDLNMLAAMKEE